VNVWLNLAALMQRLFFGSGATGWGAGGLVAGGSYSLTPTSEPAVKVAC
jgi:hypothetical protein